MGHHRHVTTVCAGNTGYVVVRTIGVGRIALVGVFEHHVVVAFGLGKLEFTFAVCNPDAKTIARKTLEEYAAVGLHRNAYETAFKLVAVVVEHTSTLFVFGIDEVEFHHKLATIANTEGESVGTCIEAVEGFLCLRIEEEGSCPTFGTAEDVAVGESTTEDDEVDVVERFATSDKVGHGDVFHIEAGKMEHIRHFAFTIRSFLTDDSRTNARGCATIRRNTEAFKRALEGGMEVEFDGLLLVVAETLSCFAVETLMLIEEEGSGIPHIAEVVDEELVFCTIFLDKEVTLFGGHSESSGFHAMFCQNCLEAGFVFICHLHQDCRVFGKELLHEIGSTEVVELDTQTAFCVGETHFQQSGDETACTDVVTSEKDAFLHHGLHRCKGSTEVSGICHCGHIASHIAKGLCEGRTTELWSERREVEVINLTVGLIYYNRAHYFAHIIDFTTCTHNDGAWRNDLLSIRILLSHGERVLTSGDIDVEFAAEIAEGFDAFIKTRVFTLL